MIHNHRKKPLQISIKRIHNQRKKPLKISIKRILNVKKGNQWKAINKKLDQQSQNS
uniref:Uncharacterized protein n=1 Tax=Amphimedon queenslandica TaxID=400682 RepID=A0A1X7VQN8_AMPQE